MGFVLPHERDAGGAVGFIADDEIEFRESGLLCFGHGGDGMVGGENNGEAFGRGLEFLLSAFLRMARYW